GVAGAARVAAPEDEAVADVGEDEGEVGADGWAARRLGGCRIAGCGRAGAFNAGEAEGRWDEDVAVAGDGYESADVLAEGVGDALELRVAHDGLAELVGVADHAG